MRYLTITYWLLGALALAAFLGGCQVQNPTQQQLAEGDSLILSIEKKIEEKKQLQEFQEKYLTKEFYIKTKRYFPVIRKYAKRYGLDWRLIVAQILKESRFRENATSQKGARGLMQIMPYTAQEITRELDFEYIAIDPRENISAGIYHLYKQLEYFPDADKENRIKLALAAYNCGPAHVFDAQDIAEYLEGKRNEWSAVKTGLTKLTSKDWKLHLEVWELGVPNYGYFYGYRETIDYVDDIYSKYELFRKLF